MRANWDALRGQRRRCYQCGRDHEVGHVAVLALVGTFKVEVRAFLCSQDCLADLAFDTPPLVSDQHRRQAFNEMLDQR